MSATFHEIRFPTKYDWGGESSPEFNVNVNSLPSGTLIRNAIWTTGRKSWKIDKSNMTKSFRVAAECFFRARIAGLYGFRFFDHDWNLLTNEPQVLVAGGLSLQLQFMYPDPINPQIQLVRKPVLSANIQTNPTLDLYSPDISLTNSSYSGGSVPWPSSGNWTLDRSTGIITFSVSQTGHTITASGSYDWPVLFSPSNKGMYKRQWIDDFEWVGIELIELLNET